MSLSSPTGCPEKFSLNCNKSNCPLENTIQLSISRIMEICPYIFSDGEKAEYIKKRNEFLIKAGNNCVEFLRFHTYNFMLEYNIPFEIAKRFATLSMIGLGRFTPEERTEYCTLSYLLNNPSKHEEAIEYGILMTKGVTGYLNSDENIRFSLLSKNMRRKI